MQTSLTIRQADAAEIPLIKQLAEATWGPTYQSILSKEQLEFMFDTIYSEEALAQQMADGQTFLLLFEGESRLDSRLTL
ncbi:hypothetical protein GCM10028895_21400 [Pontibacter rugosus]